MNPFAELTVFLSPLFMQIYIVLMILAVALGTIFDMLHKSSVQFFARHWGETKATAKRRVGGAETVSLAVKVVLNEVATAGEFCNPKRRISHLLMFYGLLTYLITTIVMVFRYPTLDSPTPGIWPFLWNLGAVMLLIGGYWFFLLLRVDVAKEGHSPFRLVRADLFIVSMLASVTFALIWEIVQSAGNLTATKIFFGIYLFCTTVLFVSVPWSKFAHMFYKPAAALQRRVEEANGSSNLPEPANVNNIVGR
jgi:hypothetical protein